ncbi:MAG: flagellar M-ring protein FliF [Deltaproteobacteria bacterium]|nr:flagellar M-ring protein FliF [Deltaproteobacteria bacterium]
MNRFLAQLKAWHDALEAPQRTQLWIGVALTVAVISVLGWYAASERYQPLLSGRAYDDLLTAAAALDAESVPYRIRDNGSLEVPDYALGKARAAVAAADILPGIHDVAELKLGLTPRAQEWAFLRAREGDLARMINGIAEINGSQVSIVPREESLYFGEERPASASVFLRLRPGARMNPGQVRAIINLVSNAVESLDPSQITIADDQGNLLSEIANHSGDAPEDLLKYKTSLERRYESAVAQAMLPVLGTTSAFSVTAAVDLDMTSTETVSKRVDIEKQAVLSEQMDESSNAQSAPQGVPGVDANLPERSAPNGTGRSQNSERSSSTFNYMYPTVDEIQRRPAGGVTRVSVAVQVDQGAVDALVKAGRITDAEAFRASLTAAVQAAVGYDEARKDVLTLSMLPFANREWVEEAEVTSMSDWIMKFLPWITGLIGLVLTFLYVVRPVMSAATQPLPSKDAAQLTDGEEAAASKKEPVDEDEQLAQRLRSLVDNFQPIDSSDLNRLVERESTAAAQVVRMWSKET